MLYYDDVIKYLYVYTSRYKWVLRLGVCKRYYLVFCTSSMWRYNTQGKCAVPRECQIVEDTYILRQHFIRCKRDIALFTVCKYLLFVVLHTDIHLWYTCNNIYTVVRRTEDGLNDTTNTEQCVPPYLFVSPKLMLIISVRLIVVYDLQIML